jgi:integrase/recombinase XerD
VSPKTSPASPLFPFRHGGSLTRDGIERRLAKHVATAQRTCPTLGSKRVSMHALRHTAAMTLLNAGIDNPRSRSGSATSRSAPPTSTCTPTQRTLDRVTPANGHPGRYRAPDTLLAFLERPLPAHAAAPRRSERAIGIRRHARVSSLRASAALRG